MVRTAVVIPNHLPHLDFLKEWPELEEHTIIVIQDVGKKPKPPAGFSDVTIYDHADIKKDLGKNDWIIPSQTSACRSYGYYKAWQTGADVIITLDNDCYAESPYYFVDGHVDNLKMPVTLDWAGSDNSGRLYRGFPYEIREKSPVYLSHGLWSNVPDLDAPTSLHNPDLRLAPCRSIKVIPRFNFFPMCGMNLAWRRDLTPAMYFGLFGPTYGFDQYDDIFAGVLVKKVMDHLGLAARSGFPSVKHRKQSNVFTNLRKQAPGMAMNEHFWKEVQKIKLTKSNILDCYKELITKLPKQIKDEPEGWTARFKEAALIWVSLYEDSRSSAV